ncbi:MAG TPA: efflux RND transporter periplasmic adaptor subunit [Polyangia bacterium]|nr:efflux RND transporter periplasmic adaptor subunit [Polyangia bacterium]
MTGANQDNEELGRILAAGKRRGRLRKAIIAIVVLVAAGVAALFYFGVIGSRGSIPEDQYEVVAVTIGDIKASINATGTVEPLNTVEVGAEVSGKIAELHVDFNDPVTADQLLAVIDPEQAKAQVDEAKAQVLSARAKLAEARATLNEAHLDEERSLALAGKGLLSSKELEAAVSKAERARASLMSARASAAVADASYSSAKTRLGKTEIRSPINGTVLSRLIEVGQTINAGMQTPVLFTIAEDLRRMRLSSKVDEADIGAVVVGQQASFTVDAHPDRTFASGVESVRNVAITSDNVVSYEVLLAVDNEDLLLKPGMTASAEIVTLFLGGALLVPNRALRFSPPTESRMPRPPPGLSFLGGGQGKKAGGDRKGASQERLGALGARKGVVWVVKAGTPEQVVVEKLASDGTNTAIASETLQAGIEVIVGLAEPKGASDR